MAKTVGSLLPGLVGSSVSRFAGRPPATSVACAVTLVPWVTTLAIVPLTNKICGARPAMRSPGFQLTVLPAKLPPSPATLVMVMSGSIGSVIVGASRAPLPVFCSAMVQVTSTPGTNLPPFAAAESSKTETTGWALTCSAALTTTGCVSSVAVAVAMFSILVPLAIVALTLASKPATILPPLPESDEIDQSTDLVAASKVPPWVTLLTSVSPAGNGSTSWIAPLCSLPELVSTML